MKRFSLAILVALACVAAQASDKVATITPQELYAKLATKNAKPLVVDVREPQEFEAGHIAGAKLAPLDKVDKEVAAVEKNRDIVLVCRSGRRSALAYRRLVELGFTSLKNMEGGMVAWEKLGLPVEKK